MADETPKTAKQIIGEGFREGIKQRVENSVSGSGGGYSSNNSPSGGHYGFVVIVALFLVIVLLGGPLYAECKGSGFCETRLEPIIEPVVEAVQSTFGFAGKQARQTRAIISGEQTFSWTSDVDNRERSGVWFDNERAYGINLGEREDRTLSVLGSEFGAITDIVVGKMDENIKELEGELSCSLDDINGKFRGVIGELDTNKIKLFPPSETEKISIHGPYDCVFTQGQIREKAGLIRTIEGKPYFSKDILFNLTYSLSPTVSLPVFVIPDGEIYDGYRGKLGDAFEELAGGSYEEYSRGVNSKVQYDTEVQAVLQIINQPILPDEGALIGIQFKNKDIKNMARINKFNFTLPNGLSISGGAKIDPPSGGTCDWFDEITGAENSYEFNLNHPDVISDLKDLNRGTGETRPFLCKLRVEGSVLRDVDLLKLGDVEGTLVYSYTINEIVKISN